MWDLSSQREPVWSRTPYKEEVQSIDWSPDGKWIASASRDGKAFLHDAQNGKQLTELHTLFLLEEGNDNYRFRTLKFIPGKSLNLKKYERIVQLTNGPVINIIPLI